MLPEPKDGVYIHVKYGDGSDRLRRFHLKQSIQVLFDFVGSDAMATEVFHIQTATSCTATPSTAMGTLSEHGITGPTTVYALWLSPEDVQEKVTQISLTAGKTFPSPVDTTAVPLTEGETTTETVLNAAPSGSLGNFNHKHKDLEDTMAALSSPWFVPIEEAAAERLALSNVSPVTSLLSSNPRAKRKLLKHHFLLERRRAELEANRAELEQERAQLDQEKVELAQERVELEQEKAMFSGEMAREKVELERQWEELRRKRTRLELRQRALSLFHILMRKL
ncbi:hypothetical protein GJAV_G00248470 [Gymnothorax javanicus]|nr:hypothetical protein GJAV_G00248470 [Gymnothorax javanicus]